MSSRGPRIVLIGGTYRALCVLEHLIERGERVVAFVGQETKSENDFCREALEVCQHYSIPARSARKFGEEIIRWLEDRIRPDLAISVGVNTQIPLAIGGNCRLGLVETIDCLLSESSPGVLLRQRGQTVASREVTPDDAGADATDFYMCIIDEINHSLDQYLERICSTVAENEIQVPFDGPFPPVHIGALLDDQEPGSETRALEEEVADYLAAEHVFALRSHREALALLIRSLDLPRDHEVICPAVVSQAALDAIRSAGLVPVAVDIEPQRLTLDPDRVTQALTPRTRAMLIAHPFGQPAALDALYALADSAQLEVIEDGGSSLGARFQNSRLGRGPCACAFREKLFPGDAGLIAALVTVPAKLASRLAAQFEGLRLGNAASSLARERLRSLDDRITQRRMNAGAYSAELGHYDAFEIPPTPEEALPTYAGYLLRISRFARTTAEDLVKLLGESGVHARRPVLPFHDRDLGRLVVADTSISNALLLPVETHLTAVQRDHVLDCLFSYAIG